jgi:excisionase family DNA binding protein
MSTPHVIDLQRYYETPEAACVALRISRPTLHRRINDGTLHTLKVGATRLIEKPAAVERAA